MYTTKKLNSWSEFKEITSKLRNHWIYRGQGDASWDLSTSFERTGLSEKHEFLEMGILSDFKSGLSIYNNNEPKPNTIVEWLSLLQHHGGATRLLDFTYSPFIASFFAFENHIADEVSIWAIDQDYISKRLFNFLHKNDYGENFKEFMNMTADENYSKIFFENNLDCVIPIEPFTMIKRYFQQQSTFLSTGNSRSPFMEQLDFLTNGDKFIFKFILPSKLRTSILNELHLMNINKVSLFPDLDGYAKYISMKPELYSENELDEILDEHEFLIKEDLR